MCLTEGYLVIAFAVLTSILIGLLGAVFVHEAGHAIFAIACGYGVSNMKLHLLSISFLGESLKLERNAGGCMGQCVVYERRQTTDRAAELVALGGCIMNFTAALIAFVLLSLAGTVFSMLLLLCLAVFNLFGGVENLLPSASNDGATFKEIRSYGCDSYNKLMNIETAVLSGKAYSDMPGGWFVPKCVGGSMTKELIDIKHLRDKQMKNTV